MDPAATASSLDVVLTPSASCVGGLPANCAVLAELELYATVDSFENERVGAAPRGYEVANLTTIARSGAIGSGHALRIHDTSSTVHARAARSFKPIPSASFSFQVRPVALPGAFLFDLLGRTAEGKQVAAYHLAVFADGSVNRYDSASWSALTPAGRVPVGQWTAIEITATPTAGTLFVNDVEAAALVPIAATVSLDGLGFASAGTAPTGDDILVDEVLFEPR